MTICIGIYFHFYVTEHWQFQSWPSRCLMPRTWWLPVIHAMADTSQWLQFSVAECPWRRLMSKCWMYRTRIPPTLWSGYPTMWRQQSVTFHLVVSRYKWVVNNYLKLLKPSCSTPAFCNKICCCKCSEASLLFCQVIVIIITSSRRWKYTLLHSKFQFILSCQSLHFLFVFFFSNIPFQFLWFPVCCIYIINRSFNHSKSSPVQRMNNWDGM